MLDYPLLSLSTSIMSTSFWYSLVSDTSTKGVATGTAETSRWREALPGLHLAGLVASQIETFLLAWLGLQQQTTFRMFPDPDRLNAPSAMVDAHMLGVLLLHMVPLMTWLQRRPGNPVDLIGEGLLARQLRPLTRPSDTHWLLSFCISFVRVWLVSACHHSAIDALARDLRPSLHFVKIILISIIV